MRIVRHLTVEAFELVGRRAGLGGRCQRVSPVVRHGEIPLRNILLRFKN
jgi:hypothetical protein